MSPSNTSRHNEALADRIREALANAGSVEEKAMFGSLCFMLDDKMCICINKGGILCRIGSATRVQAVELPGCREMLQGKRVMKDFVYVDESVIGTQSSLDYWVQLALSFNKAVKKKK